VWAGSGAAIYCCDSSLIRQTLHQYKKLTTQSSSSRYSSSSAAAGLLQGWKKPRFFGIFLRFLGFLGF